VSVCACVCDKQYIVNIYNICKIYDIVFVENERLCVRVCVCMCVYICIYVAIYVAMYNSYVTYPCMYVYIVCVCVCPPVWVGVCVCVCVRVWGCFTFRVTFEVHIL
jgi:hypothetical protein